MESCGVSLFACVRHRKLARLYVPEAKNGVRDGMKEGNHIYSTAQQPLRKQIGSRWMDEVVKGKRGASVNSTSDQ